MSIKELYGEFLRSEGVTTDSRGRVEGKIFFALRGEKYDGHRFAGDSLGAGCSLAVIDDGSHAVKGKTMLVDDVLSTLQQLALYHRNMFDIPVVAVTGSNGKTTTKELMHDVLGRKFRTLATTGNLNNHIGVPLTLLELKREHEIAVVELGANHIGEIDLLCRIVRPDHGLITNIGKAHLEGFGSLNGVLRAKSELFRYIKETGGMAFVNDDQPVLRELASELELDSLHYGKSEGCYVKGKMVNTPAGVEAEVTAGDPPVEYKVRSSLSGYYNFENILAAVCVGTYFGVPPEEVGHAIADYVPGNNRSQITKTLNNKLLLDAYNANPDSMMFALVNFLALPGKNKSVILGDMLELGSYAEEEHSKILELLSGSAYREIILVGSIFAGIGAPSGFISFKDTDRLMEWLKKNPLRNRFILLKGSRGIELERCVPLL